MPSVTRVVADGGYAGRLLHWARRVFRAVVEIVRKPADQRGFAVLPRRWMVECTLGWLMRGRRLVRDYERFPDSYETMHEGALIRLVTC